MNPVRYLLVLASLLYFHHDCLGQQADSLAKHDSTRHHRHSGSPYAPDSLARRRHDPRIATIRSAIIPGWGQIYNRKYWKLPLVYAAIGIPAYTYFDNRAWYRKCQFAIAILANYQAANIPGSAIPDTILNKVNIKLRPFLVAGDDNSLRTYRNEFRKDEDYSVLFFLLFWGLNVVDATVDAHLMYFDVSDKLTMQFQSPSPGFMPPGTTPAGISVVFDFHKSRYKPFRLQ